MKKSTSRSPQSKHQSSQRKLANSWLRRSLWFLGAIAGLYFLWFALISIFVDKVPADCIDPQAVSRDNEFHRINATKVVLQPWMGEHHSYGLFAVPKQYADKFDSQQGALVKINGSDRIIYATVSKPSLYEGIVPPKDHVMFVSFLWTREVIWQILQGKYDHLQYACNWTVHFKSN